MESSDLFAPDLTEKEQRLLHCGILEWSGPAFLTDELARVIGFEDSSDLHERGRQLVQAVESGSGLPSNDWARILVATEFVFASNWYGSGLDWMSTTGLFDEESILLLRSVQRKLGEVLMDATLPPRGFRVTGT